MFDTPCIPTIADSTPSVSLHGRVPWCTIHPVRLRLTPCRTLHIRFLNCSSYPFLIPLASPGATITTPLTALRTSPPPYLISHTHYATHTDSTTYIATLPRGSSLGPLRSFSLDRTTLRRHRREAIFDALIIKLEIHLGYLQQIVDQILPHSPPDFDEAVLYGDTIIAAGAMGGLREFLVDVEQEMGKVKEFREVGIEVRGLVVAVERALEMEGQERLGELEARGKWEMYFCAWKRVGELGKEVVQRVHEVAKRVVVEGMREKDLEDFEAGMDEGEIKGIVEAGGDYEKEIGEEMEREETATMV